MPLTGNGDGHAMCGQTQALSFGGDGYVDNHEMATPLHTKSLEYQRRGLFDGVRHFSELEQRIEALSDEQQRGDVFEVFTEAYFATQRPHDAHTLWPQSAAPATVL